MRKRLYVYLMFLFLFLTLPAMTQKMLFVKKDGTKHNAKFYVGDIISFKYCDGDRCTKVKGRINVIEDETIIVGYTSEYEIKNITKIFIDRKAIQILQPVVGGAGVLYLGLTGLNTLISKDEELQMSTADYVVPLSMMAASAAITPLNKRKYHLDKPHKYTLLVLDLNE